MWQSEHLDPLFGSRISTDPNFFGNARYGSVYIEHISATLLLIRLKAVMKGSAAIGEAELMKGSL